MVVENMENLEQGLECFLNKFPYGAKGLIKKLPENSYTDQVGGISYKVENQTLSITKPDPLGEIFISLKKISGNKINLIYQMKYPETD